MAAKCKWPKKGVDVRVLNEWEHKVNECIERRIGLIRRKHIYRKSMSSNPEGMENICQNKYVLVSADKAANNVTVVCTKYYLEIR